MSHDAKAVRGQYGDPSLWRATCGCGWRAEASSREDAQRLAKVHAWSIPAERRLLTALQIAQSMTCQCYDPDEMEMAPEKCAKCRLLELGGAA